MRILKKRWDDLHSMAFDPLGLETDLTLDSRDIIR